MVLRGFLRSILGRSRVPAPVYSDDGGITPSLPGKPRSGLDALLANVPRYPPFLEGLPVVDPDELLRSQSDLVARIQQSIGLDAAAFRELLLPVFLRYARFVQLLPASDNHHHRGAGGLLRHGLEVAYNASRLSEGVVFQRDRWPSEKKVLEPRYRVASVAAGLCHDLGKPVSNLDVLSKDGNHRWFPHSETLYDWARRTRQNRYYLRWRSAGLERHEPVSIAVLPVVIDGNFHTWLNGGGQEIVEQMTEAIAGIDRNAANPITDIVKHADSHSTKRDLQTWRQLSGTSESLGVPAEKHLVDAMRRLYRAKRWAVNAQGARLWCLDENGESALFLVWPAAAEEIARVIDDDQVPGIPKSPRALLEVLADAGVIATHASEEDGTADALWRIQPAFFTKKGNTVTLTAVRLRSYRFLMEIPPHIDGGRILAPGEEEGAAPPASRPPAAGEAGSTRANAQRRAATREPASPSRDDAPPPRPGNPASSSAGSPSPRDTTPQDKAPKESKVARLFRANPGIRPQVEQLVEHIKTNAWVHGEHFAVVSPRLFAVTAAALKSLSPRLLVELEQARLLRKDGARPMLKTVDVHGLGHAAVFEPGLSEVVWQGTSVDPDALPALAAKAPAVKPDIGPLPRKRKAKKDPGERPVSAGREQEAADKPPPGDMPGADRLLRELRAFSSEQPDADMDYVLISHARQFADQRGFPFRQMMRALIEHPGVSVTAEGIVTAVGANDADL